MNSQIPTVAEARSSLASERRQRRDDALMYSDVADVLRDAEEKIALLLKYCGDGAAEEIMRQLEEARGIAGKMKLDNE